MPKRNGHPRVLLVHDEEPTLESLAFFFRQFGFRTAKAHNTQEAVAKTASENPDVILVDYGLKGANGSHPVEAIKKAAGKKVPMLVVSTQSNGDCEGVCCKTGAECCRLTSGSDWATIPIRVEKLLESGK